MRFISLCRRCRLQVRRPEAALLGFVGIFFQRDEIVVGRGKKLFADSSPFFRNDADFTAVRVKELKIPSFPVTLNVGDFHACGVLYGESSAKRQQFARELADQGSIRVEDFYLRPEPGEGPFDREGERSVRAGDGAFIDADFGRHRLLSEKKAKRLEKSRNFFPGNSDLLLGFGVENVVNSGEFEEVYVFADKVRLAF